MTRTEERTLVPRHAGFSLLEVVFATALVATTLVSVAQLLLVAANANRTARRATIAAALARQKAEQLRSLSFFVDASGAAVTDTTSDLSVSPPAPSGGAGLLPSPATALTANTPGYVDYLNVDGTWVGTGSSPPAGTAYVRRWLVLPLPANPAGTLFFQVLVTGPPADPHAPSASLRLQPGDALIVTMKTRKAE